MAKTDDPNAKQDPSPPSDRASREAQLAAALRANLKRRKAPRPDKGG